jgi:acyl-CoA synthetase (AMP-forming)/AMP-acid ligase II
MERPDPGYPATIPASIRRAAAESGDHEFIVMPDRRLTYAEADAASQRVAKELLAAGIGKGTRVGVLDTFSTEWIVAWLAIARIGALFIPFGSTFRPAELRRAVRHADVHTLLVPPIMFGNDMHEFVEAALPGLAGSGPAPLFLEEFPFLRDVRIWGPSDRAWAGGISLAVDGEPTAAGSAVSDALLRHAEAEVTPADLMVVIYTSGATSDPKGIVHTHGSQVRHGYNLAHNFATPVSPDERTFCALPFFWIGGLSFILMSTLYRGATVMCVEKFEAGAALDLIERERATKVAGWAPTMAALVQHPTFAQRDLSSVVTFAPREGPPVDPDLRHNSLGMSETSGPHSAARPDEAARTLPESLRGSFGRGLPGVQLKVVDPDTGADVGEGESGELCVRGYSVMDGMYKRERADAFDDDGWYHTGDQGSLRDGLLFFTGRLGEMIKTGGANVTPREVEVVLEAYPEIELALVVGLPDAERGQLVAAVLVPAPGADIDVDEIATRLRTEISGFKVPRRFVLMTRDEVPWLPTAKPDKRTLVARLSAAS